MITNLYQKLNQYTYKQQLQLILGLGILIRLAIMPFFMHEDLSLTYGRAYTVAFEGQDVFEYNQQISHLIETVNLKAYDILFPAEQLLPLPLPTSDSLRAPIDDGSLYQNPYLKLNIFWMKLPYLAFDLIALYLLLKLVSSYTPNQKLAASAFYFLNPILIFSVYVFGRYEVFPIAFLLASLLFSKQGRYYLSSLVFGLLILTRSSMLMILPIHILLNGNKLKHKVANVVLSTLPFILTNLYKGSSLGRTDEFEWVTNGRHTNFTFAYEIKLDFESSIFPFVAVYALIIFGILMIRYKDHDYRLQAYFYGLVFTTYYALGFYHPQYLTWVIPLLAIIMTNRDTAKQVLISYGIIVVSFPVLLLTWNKSVFMGIFRPANEWLGTRDLAGVIDNYYPSIKLANFARSVISAMSLIQTYLLLTYLPGFTSSKLVKNLKSQK